MRPLSRRDFLDLALTVPAAGLASTTAMAALPGASPADVHQQILELAAVQEHERRARFAAVKNKGDLDVLGSSLRQTFLKLVGDLPDRQGVPSVRKAGTIEADDYVVDKLVFESFPGYFVSALLYKPKKITTPVPGVLSPCGHSVTGKAAGPYQILHINLAKRGYVVLTYDPVGQGERSQFWDAAKGRSRFNLSCGEHAVLGNPLYLLGTNLARYRIFDGLRGLDYLVSLPEVDASRIGCVGNSGGGTLTAYIAALDSRVRAVAIGCYITTLRRRMGNRIQQDPDADPEQDIFGFVSEGIDHAGLLAMIAPRPTLLGFARFDFFPIEGARETFDEARRLYEVAGAGDRIDRVEAAERHGLSLPLRTATYEWFGRWLSGNREAAPATEFAVSPRPAQELLVCKDGQVSLSFRSRPLLPLALEQFDGTKRPERIPLRQLLNLDTERADPHITRVSPGSSRSATAVLCVNGNETRDWRDETRFFDGLARHGLAVTVVDPRGVAQRRPGLAIFGRNYADPLVGVEENIAYNAFLVGKSLLGMRVTDVLVAVRKLLDQDKPGRIVLCARRDAALTACFAAAVEPAIESVATEDMVLSFRGLFSSSAAPINAASILPDLLRRFGDIADVLAEIAPRRILVAAGVGTALPSARHISAVSDRFSANSRLLTDWIGE
ncbi:MAG TPA: acetylxylan esterase [Isosphaeraceae bacterium]|nr:acetylxylan esterase [Isosphaeraceae bacterium]